MSMFFKLFGLRYSNPVGSPTLNDKDYLSNLQFPRTGDVLVDEDGNPVAFGDAAGQRQDKRRAEQIAEEAVADWLAGHAEKLPIMLGSSPTTHYALLLTHCALRTTIQYHL